MSRGMMLAGVVAVCVVLAAGGASAVVADVDGGVPVQNCPGQFDCHNGTCIDLWYVNNGNTDCPDGSDENCLGHGCCFTQRENVGFLCDIRNLDMGQVCIEESQVGDGYADCPFGEDEGEILQPCNQLSPPQFDCGDGTCVDFGVVDDGTLDCPTAVDEDCYGRLCCLTEAGEVGFLCNADSICLSLSQVDDGYLDCPAGEDECTTTNTCPEIPPNPSDGTSSGDPHMSSLDGLYYDFQLLGKFVYCGTPDFVVQTCQQPWIYNPSMVAVNHAVAVGAAGQGVFQLQFDESSNSFLTFINGVSATLTSGSTVTLGSVGRVTRNAGSYLFQSNSGYTVRFEADDWAQWIGIQFHAPSQNSATFGLCGTADGNANNDMTGRDGTVFPPLAGDASVRAFGQTWRLASEEDLFTSGLSCPASLPGYQPFSLDLLTRVGQVATKASAKVAAKAALASAKSAGRHARTAATEEQWIFVYDHLWAVLPCLTEEQRNVFYSSPSTPAEFNARNQVLQLVLDLLVFYNPTTGVAPFGNSCQDNPVILQQASFNAANCAGSLDSCNARGVCLGSVAGGDLRCQCDPGFSGPTCGSEDSGETAEVNLFCDGTSSCSSGSVSSSTARRVSLTFSSSGSC